MRRRIYLQNTGRQASSVLHPVHWAAFWSKWTYSSWRQIQCVLRLSWQINTKLLVMWVLFLEFEDIEWSLLKTQHVLQLLGILLLWGYKRTNWSSVCDIRCSIEVKFWHLHWCFSCFQTDRIRSSINPYNQLEISPCDVMRSLFGQWARIKHRQTKTGDILSGTKIQQHIIAAATHKSRS